MQESAKSNQPGYSWKVYSGSIPSNVIMVSSIHCPARAFIKNANEKVLGTFNIQTKEALIPYGGSDIKVTNGVELLLLGEGHKSKWVPHKGGDPVPKGSIGPVENCFVARVYNVSGVQIACKYHPDYLGAFYGSNGAELLANACEILVIEPKGSIQEAKLTNIIYEHETLKLYEDTTKCALKITLNNFSESPQKIHHSNNYAIIESKYWDVGTLLPKETPLTIMGNVPRFHKDHMVALDDIKYSGLYGNEMQNQKKLNYESNSKVSSHSRLKITLTYKEVKFSISFRAKLIIYNGGDPEEKFVNGMFTGTQASDVDGYYFMESKINPCSETEQEKNFIENL